MPTFARNSRRSISDDFRANSELAERRFGPFDIS
jgi:hypothetical protein